MEGFDRFVERDKERKRQQKAEHKEITLREYLKLVEEDPAIAQLSPARIYEIIMDAGIVQHPESERVDGVEVSYRLFDEELFGIRKTIYEIARHFAIGASRGSTSKQILILIGPPASGKSSIVDIFKKALIRYNKHPLFKIKGCRKHEEPLHLLPRYARDQAALQKDECPEYPGCVGTHIHLGIKIEGDLCPICRSLLSEYRDSETGEVRWWDIPVETFTFSAQARRGIGSFEPSDDKSSSIDTLTGKENVGITSNPKYGYDHPQAYILSGEIPAAERGICEGREILACQPDLLQVFFSVAQEKELKIAGSNFPHISVDTMVIGHTNLTVFKAFSGNKTYEGLHDRFYIIDVPYPLRVDDEVRVYRKLIERESDFKKLRKCHIAPGALEIAAIFAVATRLVKSSVVDLMTKIKVYNGDLALTDLESKDKQPIDIRQLREEGQNISDRAKREGMFGVSSRAILAALNNALAEQADKNGCLTPLRTIKALREVFNHRMGISSEEIERFKTLLSVGEGGSVMQEYKEYVVKNVNRAFLHAYRGLAKELFWQYIREIELYCLLHQKYARSQTLNIPRDELTGKPKEPDMKLVRSIEQHAGVSETEALVYRGEILVRKGADPTFGPDTYLPLMSNIEKKLLTECKEMLMVVLDADKPKSEEGKKRSNEMWEAFEESGHCPECARESIEKAREFIKR
ncbi:MAG: hypothetical protein HZA35_01865 [Parcubacteria group bacterium]|nr:hypothetical protein [Parcubacteria group bacterium]